jgi:hypothetical protein
MKSKRMCLDEGYVERCCLHHILSEIFPLNTSDADDVCDYDEVLRNSHHISRTASHLDFGKSPGKAVKPGLNSGFQRL